MYSWCSCPVETEDEFKMSKVLFKKYVYSEYVLNHLEIKYSKMVINFFRLYIEPVLPYMLFYLRKHIKHYDQNSNMKLEGTFRGLQKGSTPVTPATKLFNSVALLCNIAERDISKHRKRKSYDVLSTKTYNNLRCGDEVNHRCQQILQKEWNLRGFYLSCRISSKEWLIVHDNDAVQSTISSGTSEESILPKFRRVRKVEVDDTSTFRCSCNFLRDLEFLVVICYQP